MRVPWKGKGEAEAENLFRKRLREEPVNFKKGHTFLAV